MYAKQITIITQIKMLPFFERFHYTRSVELFALNTSEIIVSHKLCCMQHAPCSPVYMPALRYFVAFCHFANSVAFYLYLKFSFFFLQLFYFILFLLKTCKCFLVSFTKHWMYLFLTFYLYIKWVFAFVAIVVVVVVEIKTLCVFFIWQLP